MLNEFKSVLTLLQQPFNISFVFANVCPPSLSNTRVRASRSLDDVSMSVSIVTTAAAALDTGPLMKLC